MAETGRFVLGVWVGALLPWPRVVPLAAEISSGATPLPCCKTGRHAGRAHTLPTSITSLQVVEQLQLTRDQFIDLCILCGCDYTGKISGIGPVRALNLIQKHGSIENVRQISLAVALL